ncbi:globin [Bradyrhizobium frederickii]|uniref:Globin n=1 Tax=Bradyrhizobium frederickii TaxID=2560054 RepID=A0A4Y9PA65_9BRAD|nr:globin [Bradyrhizobium frederickii]TFV75255.1 globin [Bradyrhizobium frederickii]
MRALRNPIEISFVLAAARCEDLTPCVYRRLFDEHPETRAMFRFDGRDLVKGSMLALAIEAILDFAGQRRGHFRLIACEAASHDGYGTPRELFIAFFTIIRDTLRDLLGDQWTTEIARAWDALRADIDTLAGATA